MAKKEELLELSDTLRSNYMSYQKDKSQMARLKAGIEAFEKAVPDRSKVKHLLRHVTVLDLPAYLDVLLLAAQSYVALALGNKDELAKHHAWLDCALGCYQLTLELIEPIGPARMTPTLGDIELDATFCVLKMAYFKAEGELHALKKEMAVENNPDSGINARLQKVQTELSAFNQTIKKQYKNTYYRKVSNITPELEAEVQKGLDEVNSLLKAPKRKIKDVAESPSTEETVFKTPVSLPKKKKSQAVQVMPEQQAAAALLALSFFGKQPEQEKPGNIANTLQFS
ncbi:hypothetical protein GH742_14085 [Legionella sp. MW5194]|uniref:hypothetical protein n=1 Tax=Legionella sp. MW5194 TaxID=2662448 RepID=UPI00193CDC5A|nr:hypothetical protein [Legionella sp. MW5194]QRN04897.1 hypothetical protein GH742_14085 [Legionella sp. MW5194]